MENKNKTKVIVDRIACLGLISVFIVLGAGYIYKMITGKPTIHLITALLAILVIGFGAIFITTKRYGPYREEKESVPFLIILIFVSAVHYINAFVFGKADIIAETTTNIKTGSLQIIGILTAYLIFIVVLIKFEQWLENKYNQYRKAKKRTE